MLAVAVPVLVFVLADYTQFWVLTRSFDRLHMFLVGGTVAVLAAAVATAAAGFHMSWSLLLVMLAPVVTIVGYEVRGHEHVARLLADERGGGRATDSGEVACRYASSSDRAHEGGPDSGLEPAQRCHQGGRAEPETFEAEWTDGATGRAVGAFFRGQVRRNGVGQVKWSQCKVTHCEQGGDFGFTVYMGGKRLNNWRYQLVPTDGGTAVTECSRWSSAAWPACTGRLAGWHRRRVKVKRMRQMEGRVIVRRE